jgi:hypothetical protein
MRGTTMSTAKHMMRVSGKSRPATSGNKNVKSRASRKGAQVPDSMVGKHIKGPDRGNG